VESVLPTALVILGGTVSLLLHRVIILGRENKLCRRRMTEVDEMKKALISHVSHELKAPLASMQETTHLILEQIPGPLTEKQRRLLDLNLQSGKRLAAMIGNMLDLTRLEAGIVEYEMECHDIAELVRRVVVDMVFQAKDQTLRVLTDIQSEPLIVECDSNRMIQVFSNLIENALRFSTRNGFITVHAKSEQHLPQGMPKPLRRRFANRTAGGFAVISISDSGPGIQDAHKQKVFETFHQVKQGKKTLGQSLGLGLAIAKSLVEAHHGAIWIEDNPNGGSVFFVVVPCAEAGRFRQAS
jgi:two-component system sensor histidine kinase GlrK